MSESVTADGEIVLSDTPPEIAVALRERRFDNPLRIYSAYDVPRVSGLLCGEQSYVQPQFAAECDISNILAKFNADGIMPESRPGFYGDVSDIPDLQTVYEVRDRLQDTYEDLPEALQERFPTLQDFADFVLLSSDEEIASVMDLSTSPSGRPPVEPSPSVTGASDPVDPVVKSESPAV